MERRNIAYWLTTGTFCLVLGFSGATHFLHMKFMVESMSMLGYPVYFMTIIGTFKLLGIAALLAPRMPLLKEWAYAGFTFNLIGATASHLYASEPISHWIRPLVVLGICAASYLLRPDSRRLPDSFALAAGTPGNAGASAVSPPLARS
jgi:hypothetical protein